MHESLYRYMKVELIHLMAYSQVIKGEENKAVKEEEK